MEQSVGAGGASGYGRPYPCPSRPGPRGVGVRDSPFSTSRQPDRDSRPPMPTDSRPCFMSAGGRAFARVPGPARRRSPHYRCPAADCVSAVSRDTNPVCQSQCPHHSRRETAHAPRAQLTAEEGSVPSGVPLRQGHLVLHLVQDGGQDTAEGSGAVLSRGAGSEAGLADRGPSSPSPAAPSTLFSKLYLLRSRDSVARRSPCVRAPRLSSRLATMEANLRSPASSEIRKMYSGAETWLDRWVRPNCWIARSALQGSSNVMWTRRLWFWTRRSAWRETPELEASEMMATS